MAELGKKLTDHEAMNLAIQVAQKGAGFTSPNPLVGAVILDKNKKLISTGYHAFCGGDHAEIAAIKNIDLKKLKDAHLFVTLEPCSHQGRTPSCAMEIIKHPFSTVTYGAIDPNPKVSGSGIEIIKKSGIKVSHLTELEKDCKELAEVFFLNQKFKRPFVSLKVATSLDGFMALKNGESKWITGEAARLHGHYLRATHDAICIGAKTLLIDNPSLDIRHPDFKGKKNKVIVIDSRGDLETKLKDFKILISHPKEDIKCIYLKSKSVLKETLESLYEEGIHSVLLEGGAKTYTTFIEQGLVDKIYCFIAPSLIGNTNGYSWTQSLNIENLGKKVKLSDLKISHFGSDILIETKLLS